MTKVKVDEIMMCANWADRLVPSIKATCKCGQEIAVAADNWSTVTQRKMTLCCLKCCLILSLSADTYKQKYMDYMVGGVAYDTLDAAVAAISKDAN